MAGWEQDGPKADACWTKRLGEAELSVLWRPPRGGYPAQWRAMLCFANSFNMTYDEQNFGTDLPGFRKDGPPFAAAAAWARTTLAQAEDRAHKVAAKYGAALIALEDDDETRQRARVLGGHCSRVRVRQANAGGVC